MVAGEDELSKEERKSRRNAKKKRGAKSRNASGAGRKHRLQLKDAGSKQNVAVSNSADGEPLLLYMCAVELIIVLEVGATIVPVQRNSSKSSRTTNPWLLRARRSARPTSQLRISSSSRALFDQLLLRVSSASSIIIPVEYNTELFMFVQLQLVLIKRYKSVP